MFGRFFGKRSESKGSDFIIEDDEDIESDFIRDMKDNLIRLIAYAESADPTLQREVAERLANEAVMPDRQVQIVESGGLQLLIPLTKSTDREVRRLAAHALANLSVNAENQILMAENGAIELLISLLDFNYELAQRQAAKALANLGVNSDNKRKIGKVGAIPKLVDLIASEVSVSVKIEVIAAMANLAVNDENEEEIIAAGALLPLIANAQMALDELLNSLYGSKSDDPHDNYMELAAQCARCLRNLSVKPKNRSKIIDNGGLRELQRMSKMSCERVSSQAKRALKNIDPRKNKK